MAETQLVWGGQTRSDERTLAMIAHIAGLFAPIIGAAIIWVIQKDRSAYVGYHALQAILFQLIATVLAGATFGVGLLLFILPIVWAVKANNGEWAGYPLIEGVGRPQRG
ncbi:MAG: DUF4870 domain-containing protein [Myxococcota bacterium]